ncbi:type II toxin-antitoxin system death-on-curing family toxin [Amaricoccus sp.]|uniref:type II toxin-antitoxin system death-on-curing family toxin n=1 Tax=Amaricoccus sp. TaxID=1872485 RepID=UPI001B3DCC69|nr:type II toxin-antitoxin system death-on-curing family toxin [Amaricoccus sp.]MBP7001457.1 type II toxin-antitoxin system death-on-curing family toxin [Amaricoccus sp.]
MTPPVWMPVTAVVLIHDRQIARHGGAPGLRDRGSLEMGCDRPRNLFAYGEPTLADLAAAYAFGVIKAHAFVDGNKRTALVTALAFLRLNGQAFRPETQEGLRMVEGLASGAVRKPEFARWLGHGMRPVAAR